MMHKSNLHGILP